MEQSLENSLSFIGWAMYYKNYTKEKLDNIKSFELIMLLDDFKRWVQQNSI